MKKTLLIMLLLALAGPKLGWTKIVAENVTVTAQDNSSVNIPANVPWGVGTDGKDHRFAVDNTGAMKVTIPATVNTSSQTALSPTGMTAYTALSYSATTVNLTTSAGASVPCMVCLSSNGGAAAGSIAHIAGVAASSSVLVDVQKVQ